MTSLDLHFAHSSVVPCHCDERTDRRALRTDLIWLVALVHHGGKGTADVAEEDSDWLVTSSLMRKQRAQAGARYEHHPHLPPV